MPALSYNSMSGAKIGVVTQADGTAQRESANLGDRSAIEEWVAVLATRPAPL